MQKEIYKSSLRDALLDDVSKFMKREGFRPSEIYPEGLLLLINLVSDYYEEGKHLYPEVIVTQDLEGLQLPVSRTVFIQESNPSIGSFRQALKLCAPLAVDGWVIYIELKEDCIRFGVFSTEITETSLSLYRQTMHNDYLPPDSTFAYLRCVGQKVVELRGKNGGMHIYLNLDGEINTSDNEIERLSKIITYNCDGDDNEKLSIFFEKLIDNSLKAGHGNLIGVVEDKPEKIARIKESLNDGIYLNKAIDMAAFIRDVDIEKSSNNSVSLRAYSSLMSSMINHDGITLITDTGKLLGYHLFVKQELNNRDVSGGARSRAFESMKQLDLKACFYKSQDGNMKLYEHE